jgi:tRNA-2-methylthio-N6-dimethylallyladenosine synthase
MKKIYIETFGCAMNHKDSENILAELRGEYSQTANLEEADLIIVNTCSVREKPVHKLFSELGSFNKKKKDGAKIGVTGCTASHLGETILKRAPYINFVLGSRNVSKILEVINKKGAVEVDINHDDSLYIFGDSEIREFKKFINISIGCDKKCAFCIVPYTRGTEISIPEELIYDEVKKGVQAGAKEFILLGQNVNNYGRRFSTPHRKINFTTLLHDISEIEGVERIRFTSPHPLHIDKEFIQEFASNKKIANSIHIPLQSGSTEILRKMKRGYTKEWFLERVELVRNLAKGISISTDVIVGFPGETEKDFLDTMEVLEKSRFEQMFSFKYSPRPFTEALKFQNKIADEVASERLKILQDRHLKIMEELARKRIGEITETLFSGFNNNKLLGRSSENLLIKVNASESQAKKYLGQIQKVQITKSFRTEAEGMLLI